MVSILLGCVSFLAWLSILQGLRLITYKVPDDLYNRLLQRVPLVLSAVYLSAALVVILGAPDA